MASIDAMDASLISDERTFRYRVSVDTTSKGLHSYGCTIEGVGYSQDEILAMSDALVRELDARYHPDEIL